MNPETDYSRIPRHVAIIMDGNGRWAKQRGQMRLYGHKAGMDALIEIVRHSDEIGIKYLTVYAFSTENWKRPPEEVSGIFKLLITYVAGEIEELSAKNVRVGILGDWSVIPENSRKSVQLALDKTKNNTGMRFNIALNYGGRAEIIRAVKSLIDEGIPSSEITENLFSSYLYTSDIPDPELIIRTSGEMRLSNFLIWQGAYSELVVTPVLWPDFSPEEYDKCIAEYQRRNRRFGGIK